MNRNIYKKITFEDKFGRKFYASKYNHPEGFAWWKKYNRKLARLKLKRNLEKECGDRLC